MQHFRSVLRKATLLATASAALMAAVPAASASARPAHPAASCDKAPFHRLPITVKRTVHVPPTPVIKGVRTGKHADCGYDRLVLDVGGKLPGLTVRFVKHVISDPSGNVIKLPGKRFVLITLRPANAHKKSGNPTISRKVHKPGFPMLKAWVLAGDDEGVVSFGIGLAGPAKVRVGKLAGRIFLDFKEP
jgi:hypothetical protein